MSLIRRIDLRDAGSDVDYRAAVPRADFDIEAAVPAVHAICEEVRTRGLDAIVEFGEKFDGVRVEDIRVAPATLQKALDELDPDIRAGLEESIRRLRATCANELETDAVTDLGPGARVTHRKVPVGRVGLYVPGGLAPLVSSVLMNVVPAQTAGVESIALASPPQKEFGGSVHPTILAACALLGVEEVYAVGGAQAIAMFAYGSGPCQRVDLVTGPGNIWVVTAKRLLKGQIGIDSEAGPTEIAVLADDTGEASYVAADLISQAEHDPLAASVLVTPSVALADAVRRVAEVDATLAVAPRLRDLLTFLLAPTLEPAPIRREDAPPGRTAAEVDAVLKAAPAAPAVPPEPPLPTAPPAPPTPPAPPVPPSPALSLASANPAPPVPPAPLTLLPPAPPVPPAGMPTPKSAPPRKPTLPPAPPVPPVASIAVPPAPPAPPTPK